MKNVPKIAVLGDGGWGTTLALLLDRKGYSVTLWGIFPEYIDLITKKRENIKFLSGIQIPISLILTHNIYEAIRMKIILTVFISLLILSLFLVGCSSDEGKRFQGGPRGDFPGDRDFRLNKSMNMSDEERQAMMEERQQNMIEACSGKNEGDKCQIQSPRGEMGGVCKTIDDDIICTMNMNGPMRPR